MSYSPSPSRPPDPRAGLSQNPGNALGGRFSGLQFRLIIGAAIVLISIFSFLGTSQINPITGKPERVRLTINEEIQLGLEHASQLGQVSRNYRAQEHIAEIGAKLVEAFERDLQRQNIRNPFRFQFTLLADPNMVNAFALPGGQVFITEGLYRRLKHNGQLAAVLAHEMGHVVERHSSKQMAKSGLINGVSGAASILGGDPSSSRAAASIGNLVTMRYSREAEFEADGWAVELIILAGYTPEHMVSVLELLQSLNGGAAPPEFLSTHPNTASRIEFIRNVIVQRSSQYQGFREFE